jgi:hypothetical protein
MSRDILLKPQGSNPPFLAEKAQYVDLEVGWAATGGGRTDPDPD